MAATITVQGVDAAVDRLRATELRMRGRLEQALDRTALATNAHLKRLLSEPGSGRVYTRRGVEHQASAPGEPPAVDTGVYRASWHVRTTAGIVGDVMGREVYTQQERAEALEFGTLDGHIRPRPHAGPAAEFGAREFRKQSERELGRER